MQINVSSVLMDSTPIRINAKTVLADASHVVIINTVLFVSGPITGGVNVNMTVLDVMTIVTDQTGALLSAIRDIIKYTVPVKMALNVHNVQMGVNLAITQLTVMNVNQNYGEQSVSIFVKDVLTVIALKIPAVVAMKVIHL